MKTRRAAWLRLSIVRLPGRGKFCTARRRLAVLSEPRAERGPPCVSLVARWVSLKRCRYATASSIARQDDLRRRKEQRDPAATRRPGAIVSATAAFQSMPIEHRAGRMVMQQVLGDSSSRLQAPGLVRSGRPRRHQSVQFLGQASRAQLTSPATAANWLLHVGQLAARRARPQGRHRR